MKKLCLLTCAFLIPALFPAPVAAQEAHSPAFDTVRVEGTAIAYRDVGEGEPLVMLHGFSRTGALWEPLFDDFSDYRLIVPDLRGHGRSTNPSGEFTHRQAARDVFALLDSLGVERFKGAGSSTGAMTLLHMATSQPERVEAMILVAGTSYFPESAREVMRGVSPDMPDERLAEMARPHSRGMEQARALTRQFRAFKDSYEDMNFTPPLLGTIEARTLIVHGDRDRFFPVEIPVEQYRSIPESYLWILPNTGHGVLIHTERGRERFAAVARPFLAGEWE